MPERALPNAYLRSTSAPSFIPAFISLVRPVMKRLFLSGGCALALASAASGAPALFYVNDGIVNATNLDVPVIDAINFINNNYFNVFTTAPFRSYDTRNFTNPGFM